jgi:hypothetical protein
MAQPPPVSPLTVAQVQGFLSSMNRTQIDALGTRSLPFRFKERVLRNTDVFKLQLFRKTTSAADHPVVLFEGIYGTKAAALHVLAREAKAVMRNLLKASMHTANKEHVMVKHIQNNFKDLDHEEIVELLFGRDVDKTMRVNSLYDYSIKRTKVVFDDDIDDSDDEEPENNDENNDEELDQNDEEDEDDDDDDNHDEIDDDDQEYEDDDDDEEHECHDIKRTVKKHKK